MIARTLDASVDDQIKSSHESRTMRRFAFYSFLIVFLLATVVTITLVVLGALGVVELQEPYVRILWAAFVVELVGIVGWLIRHLFKKE
jgi:thiol:disulfide interchange protein